MLKIEKFKNTNDMPNYAIEVHSLKSDLEYLNFYNLELPYKHEIESKTNMLKFINSYYNELVIEITKFIKGYKNYLRKK